MRYETMRSLLCVGFRRIALSASLAARHPAPKQPSARGLKSVSNTIRSKNKSQVYDSILPEAEASQTLLLEGIPKFALKEDVRELFEESKFSV